MPPPVGERIYALRCPFTGVPAGGVRRRACLLGRRSQSLLNGMLGVPNRRLDGIGSSMDRWGPDGSDPAVRPGRAGSGDDHPLVCDPAPGLPVHSAWVYSGPPVPLPIPDDSARLTVPVRRIGSIRTASPRLRQRTRQHVDGWSAVGSQHEEASWPSCSCRWNVAHRMWSIDSGPITSWFIARCPYYPRTDG